LLYEDETILWRFALPRAGWWRKAQRARLPIRPLSQSQIKRDESLKRQAWVRYRAWSRVTSGVLLSVIGAVQYGTSKVFYKIVPHFETEGFRQYIHQVMALFGHTGKEVVMVADRSGIHRAHKLASTLTHWHEQFRLHLLPAHCGHHLNPMEGFWRVMKDRIGAGRCFPDLHQLYQRTRRVLMEHQAYIPHPLGGDRRIFSGASFLARTAIPSSVMLWSHERSCPQRLRPWRVVWVSCCRRSKRIKSNICPS
jgi:transposase